MRKLIFLSLVVFAFALAACSEQTEEEQVEQTAVQEEAAEVVTYASWNKLCPVQGKEIDNTVNTVEYDGKDYGFCCSGCVEKFSESPETFAKNLSEDGTEFLGSKS